MHYRLVWGVLVASYSQNVALCSLWYYAVTKWKTEKIQVKVSMFYPKIIYYAVPGNQAKRSNYHSSTAHGTLHAIQDGSWGTLNRMQDPSLDISMVEKSWNNFHGHPVMEFYNESIQAWKAMEFLEWNLNLHLAHWNLPLSLRTFYIILTLIV